MLGHDVPGYVNTALKGLMSINIGQPLIKVDEPIIFTVHPFDVRRVSRRTMSDSSQAGWGRVSSPPKD